MLRRNFVQAAIAATSGFLAIKDVEAEEGAVPQHLDKGEHKVWKDGAVDLKFDNSNYKWGFDPANEDCCCDYVQPIGIVTDVCDDGTIKVDISTSCSVDPVSGYNKEDCCYGCYDLPLFMNRHGEIKLAKPEACRIQLGDVVALNEEGAVTTYEHT